LRTGLNALKDWESKGVTDMRVTCIGITILAVILSE